jgi:acetyltransferase
MSALPQAAPAPAPVPPTFHIHRYPAALIEPVRLRDGRNVIVRPVLPQDSQALQQFVSALSPISRRSRFHGAVNHLPLAVLRDMTAIDYERHVALVAQVSAGPTQDPRLVADARYVVTAPDEAEFALAVADDWQGQGLGGAMLAQLGRHARARGIRRLEGLVLEGNEAMLAAVQRLGGQWRPAAHGGSVLVAGFQT